MEWCRDLEFTITELKWERIFLEFAIETEYAGEVQFALTKFRREPLDPEAAEKDPASAEYSFEITERVNLEYDTCKDGRYVFSVNTAAVDGRSFLDNGQWRICAFIREGVAVTHVTKELSYRLDDLSRIFQYGRGKYAYNLSFSLQNFAGEDLELYFNSYFMIVNKKWKKRKYIQEAFTAKGKLSRLSMFTVIRMIRLFYGFFSRVMPKKGTNVLFMTETKDYLWGNLKYIYDRMKERELDRQFRISCTCRKAVGNNSSIASWVKTVFLIAKQDYIFIDDYAPIFGFFKLHPKTKLIQVWHAGEGFKSVGYSRFGKEGSPFPSESCHKKYDYVLTGSKNLIKVYEEVFGIEKKAFLPTGMARLDDFLDGEKIASFKEAFYREYPALEGKKVVLFAPTFRGTGQKDAYYDYNMLDLKRLYDFCGDEWRFLIKMHPFVREPIQIPKAYQDRIFDFASYPNINDLYYITDVLVTDYSSNYYEYALLKKPVLFYTYDRAFYELTRGVHRDVKSHAPGKVCDTFDELMQALETEDYEAEKIEAFVKENFGEYDGHAADRAIDEILLGKGH